MDCYVVIGRSPAQVLYIRSPTLRPILAASEHRSEQGRAPSENRVGSRL